MEGYSNNAEQLKNDLRTLKNKYIVINSSQKCDECLRSIYLEEFYIFPCLHGFHKECLLKRIAENPVECHKIAEIEEVNKKMQNLIFKANANAVPSKKIGIFLIFSWDFHAIFSLSFFIKFLWSFAKKGIVLLRFSLGF